MNEWQTALSQMTLMKPPPPVVERKPPIVRPSARATKLTLRIERYRPVMKGKGWMSLTDICRKLQVEKTAVKHAVIKLPDHVQIIKDYKNQWRLRWIGD